MEGLLDPREDLLSFLVGGKESCGFPNGGEVVLDIEDFLVRIRCALLTRVWGQVGYNGAVCKSGRRSEKGNQKETTTAELVKKNARGPARPGR